MSAPIVYTSVDAGAPALNGNARAINDVLYACLVTGYGAKAAAGWTREFDSGNYSVFRPAGGNRFYLQVLDAASWNTSYRLGAIRGYETMSAFNTGTNLFPTAAQQAGGLEVGQQSIDAAGVNRPWLVIADDRTVYWFFDYSGAGNYEAYGFGDFYSTKASDGYRTFAAGNVSGAFTGRSGLNYMMNAITLAQSSGGFYVARDRAGSALSLSTGLHGDLSVRVASSLAGNTCGFLGTIPYPNPAGTHIWLAPVYVNETADPANRGKLRGFWHWMHPTAAVADGDTFNGTGDFAGKTFRIVKAGALTGVFVVETSNTWLTNS